MLQVVPNVDNQDHVPLQACVPNFYRPRSSFLPVVEQPVRPVLHSQLGLYCRLQKVELEQLPETAEINKLVVSMNP